MDLHLIPLLVMLGSEIVSCASFKVLLGTKIPKPKLLFCQYAIDAAVVILFWAILDGTSILLPAILLVGVVLGILNYFGALCSAIAYDASMARTALFWPLAGVFSIVLFWIFLQEYKDLHPIALLGVGLHLLAIWVFVYSPKDDKKNPGTGVWLFAVIGMIAFNGIIDFLMKIYSPDISTSHFVTCWYVGSFIISGVVFFSHRVPVEPLVSPMTEEQNTSLLQKRVFWCLPLRCAGMIGNIGALYWAFQVNSGTLVVSCQALMLTFLPFAVGLFFKNHEKKPFWQEFWGFALGITAAMLIIAYH